MNVVELEEKVSKPFRQLATSLTRAIDERLALSLMEFFQKAIDAAFRQEKVIVSVTVGADGTLYALGMDDGTLFSVNCLATSSPEAMQEICTLMIGMTEGTRRAIENLK